MIAIKKNQRTDAACSAKRCAFRPSRTLDDMGMWSYEKEQEELTRLMEDVIINEEIHYDDESDHSEIDKKKKVE
ncbi:hypothetical protein QE152_g24770 [Popillia japonica]|uniref:Uncharacterized protein n=1 Tax=Popillia japonica TaxID=7064 RepID=A0AAW1K5Z9_POPJA